MCGNTIPVKIMFNSVNSVVVPQAGIKKFGITSDTLNIVTHYFFPAFYSMKHMADTEASSVGRENKHCLEFILVLTNKYRVITNFSVTISTIYLHQFANHTF